MDRQTERDSEEGAGGAAEGDRLGSKKSKTGFLRHADRGIFPSRLSCRRGMPVQYLSSMAPTNKALANY